MVEIKKLFEQFKVAGEETTSLFYQQKNKEGFEKLNELLIVMTKLIDEIFQYQINKNESLIEEKEINELLIEIMAAIEKKDTVLLSELLRFQFTEYLQERLYIQ